VHFNFVIPKKQISSVGLTSETEKKTFSGGLRQKTHFVEDKKRMMGGLIKKPFLDVKLRRIEPTRD
jgi:hypothetical protein